MPRTTPTEVRCANCLGVRTIPVEVTIQDWFSGSGWRGYLRSTGRSAARDRVRNDSSLYYCGACVIEYECHRCHERMNQRHHPPVFDENSSCWCPHCASEFLRECDNCSYSFEESTGYTLGLGSICTRCWEEETGYCCSCERRHLLSDMTRSEFEEWYCSGCGVDQPSQDTILNYNYRPPAFSYRKGVVCRKKKLKSEISSYSGDEVAEWVRRGLFFGMELEVEFEGRSGSETQARAIREQVDGDGGLYYFKRDGSLNNGFEVVTQPSDFQWWRTMGVEFMNDLTASIRQHGGGISGRCGLHIHASRSAMSRLQLFKMARFMYDTRNRDQLIRLSRRGNLESMHDYATLSLRRYNFNGATGNRYFTQSSNRLAFEVAQRQTAGNRSAALNFANPHTVELRMFKSTLNPELIETALQFYHGLIEYSSIEAGFSLRGIANWTQFKNFLTADPKYAMLTSQLEQEQR